MKMTESKKEKNVLLMVKWVVMIICSFIIQAVLLRDGITIFTWRWWWINIPICIWVSTTTTITKAEQSKEDGSNYKYKIEYETNSKRARDCVLETITRVGDTDPLEYIEKIK